MRTIQVRQIPDDAYDVIRRRAAAEGQSLQAYMHDQVVAMARTPSKREAIEAIESALERYGSAVTKPEAIADDIAAERR